jgi:hypothetical protein
MILNPALSSLGTCFGDERQLMQKYLCLPHCCSEYHRGTDIKIRGRQFNNGYKLLA